MVRDAAYEALSKTTRADLHERFADRIEASGSAVGPERLAFVGLHLEQATRYRRELTPFSPGVEELVTRTATALADAADEAREREDIPAAASLLRRAVEPGVGSSRVHRDLLLRLGQALRDTGRIAELGQVVEMYSESLDATATELDQVHVASQRLFSHMEMGEDADPRAVSATAQRAAVLARAVGDPRRLAVALVALLESEAAQGQWGEVSRVAAELQRNRRAQELRIARLNVGAAYLWGPAPISFLAGHAEEMYAETGHSSSQQALASMFRAIADAARNAADSRAQVDLAYAEFLAQDRASLRLSRLALLAVAYVWGGFHREAVAMLDLAIDDSREGGELGKASTMLGMKATLMLELQYPAADVRPVMEEAVAWTSPFDRMSIVLNTATRCLIACRTEDLDSAATLADDAIGLVDQTDQTALQADVRRWVSELPRRRGDHGAERQLLEDALERYRRKEIAFHVRQVEEQLAELT